MRKALPSELYQRLREELSRCGPFDSDRSLRVIFVDSRIAAWRDLVPENTPNRAQRVESFIENFINQHDNAGNNAFILALDVMCDRIPAGDSCHRELVELANAVKVKMISSESITVPSSSQHTKYEVHVHGGKIGVIGDNAEIQGGIHFDNKADDS